MTIHLIALGSKLSRYREQLQLRALVELGNGFDGTKVSAQDRASIKMKILKALATSKSRAPK